MVNCDDYDECDKESDEDQCDFRIMPKLITRREMRNRKIISVFLVLMIIPFVPAILIYRKIQKQYK